MRKAHSAQANLGIANLAAERSLLTQETLYLLKKLFWVNIINNLIEVVVGDTAYSRQL